MPTFNGQHIDVVVDVRTKLEFWLGHLDGAVNMPVGDVAELLPERSDVARDANILVYCASGARSAAAAAELRELGYTNVTDGGGIGAARAGYTP